VTEHSEDFVVLACAEHSSVTDGRRDGS